MTGDTDEMKEGWHLDKKVPLSIICALFFQTSALIMWATRLDNRVGTMEQSVASHTVALETMKNTQSNISVGLARIEERQIITAEGVKEIRQQLENDRRK